MKKNRIDIITMGCSKNLVDSEALMRMLHKKGYEVLHDCDCPTGEYVVINTCGFIGDAKEESINGMTSLLSFIEFGEKLPELPYDIARERGHRLRVGDAIAEFSKM